MKFFVKQFLILFLLSLVFSSCRTLDESTRQTTKPAGSLLGLTQSVPEGVAQGYATDPSYNPYGR